MYQGQCVFSGYMVPVGRGINIVGKDGKIVLTRSRKERALMHLKISSRNCRWTQSSRAFFKKTNKSAKEQSDFVQITKIVRGFTLVPRSLVAEASKTEKGKNREEERKGEKVNLKSNLRK